MVLFGTFYIASFDTVKSITMTTFTHVHFPDAETLPSCDSVEYQTTARHRNNIILVTTKNIDLARFEVNHGKLHCDWRECGKACKMIENVLTNDVQV